GETAACGVAVAWVVHVERDRVRQPGAGMQLRRVKRVDPGFDTCLPLVEKIAGNQAGGDVAAGDRTIVAVRLDVHRVERDVALAVVHLDLREHRRSLAKHTKGDLDSDGP